MVNAILHYLLVNLASLGLRYGWNSNQNQNLFATNTSHLRVGGGKTVFMSRANKSQNSTYSDPRNNRLSKYQVQTMTMHLNTNIISKMYNYKKYIELT